jgi:hypothetical protein
VNCGTGVFLAELSRMSERDIRRQVRQQRADIDVLCELTAGIDRKVDALDVKLGGRIDALDGKVDALDGKFGGQLSEVLRRLGG